MSNSPEFPTDIAFPTVQGLNTSITKGTIAGSAIYQIQYGFIALDSHNKKILGWRFLFEPPTTVVHKGRVIPSGGEHILVLVAEDGKFKGFKQHNIFPCRESDEMTTLLKNLLKKNVESFPENENNIGLLEDLSKEKNPIKYQYIIVLENINDSYPTPSSTLGNQEHPKQYAEYIGTVIQNQELKQERRKKFLEEQSKETQTKQFLEEQPKKTQTKRPPSSEKGSKESKKSKKMRKGGTKKSKRKTVSKKR